MMNSINTTPRAAEAKNFPMETASDSHLKQDWIFKARVPVQGASASEAEIPLANVVEQLDNEHALVFWMRSE